jgi:hypothetical protein
MAKTAKKPKNQAKEKGGNDVVYARDLVLAGSISIPTPEGSNTTVSIQISKDPENLWWGGFSIARPADAPNELDEIAITHEPGSGQNDVGFEYLSSAVDDAVSSAVFWLEDTYPVDDVVWDVVGAIREWRSKLPDQMDETIFSDPDSLTRPAQPDDLSAEQSFEDEMDEVNDRIARLSVEISEMRVQLGAMKNGLKIAIARASELRSRGPEHMPLFDRGRQPAKADDESWREEPLENLAGLKPKTIEILAGHDIRTMGELAIAPAVKRCELTQLAGITEKRFQEIQDASAAFWKARK